MRFGPRCHALLEYDASWTFGDPGEEGEASYEEAVRAAKTALAGGEADNEKQCALCDNAVSGENFIPVQHGLIHVNRTIYFCLDCEHVLRCELNRRAGMEATRNG
jgi:hypothetical protein